MRLQILSCHPDAGRARTGVLALAAALALAACSGGSDEVSGGSQPQAAGAPSPTVEPEPTPTPMSTCDVQEFLTASNALGQDMLVAQEQISSYVPLLIEGLAAGASGNTVLLDAKLEQIKAAMTPPSAAAIASEYPPPASCAPVLTPPALLRLPAATWARWSQPPMRSPTRPRRCAVPEPSTSR